MNINLRPFYAEGSKSVGYEIAEQLNWRVPDCVVVPMAGGSIDYQDSAKLLAEFEKLGIGIGEPVPHFSGEQGGRLLAFCLSGKSRTRLHQASKTSNDCKVDRHWKPCRRRFL